jgi:Tfp pilus assembly protein PilV
MVKTGTSAGISMLEIIVSMLILALVLLGLINVFVVSNSYLAHSRARISASQVGTVFLEPLQNDVRASDWNASSNNLSIQSGVKNITTVNGLDFTPAYEIADDPTGTTLRRVRVNITWNETRF